MALMKLRLANLQEFDLLIDERAAIIEDLAKHAKTLSFDTDSWWQELLEEELEEINDTMITLAIDLLMPEIIVARKV